MQQPFEQTYTNHYTIVIQTQFGDCSFATAGPMLWNSLPE